MLLDGYYHSALSPSYIFLIEGNIARYENVANIGVLQSDLYVGPCNYGKFGGTSPKVKAKTGKEFYNVEFLMMNGMLKIYSVVHEDQKSFPHWFIWYGKNCGSHRNMLDDDQLLAQNA